MSDAALKDAPRNLHEWLDFIQRLHPSEIDMGLDRLRQVAQRLGLVRPAALSIVVSGTNGKGSHVATIDQMLRELGYRVGTYTSPHLLHYNERVCIDGVPVADEPLIRAFAAIEAVRGDISLSFFEFGTLAALLIFGEENLDVAILEVGLGGRLDAVNLVDADIAVISSIGLDHQDWLGDTREAIAAEKAGIFRPGIPVVCSENDPPASLLAKAAELGCELYLRDRDFTLDVEGAHPDDAGQGAATWQWRGQDGRQGSVSLGPLPIPGLALTNVAGGLQVVCLALNSPQLNAASAEHPLNQQPAAGDGQALQERLLSTANDVLSRLQLPGRQQRALSPRGQPVILDVSHNAEAASALASTISQWRGSHRDGKVHLVLAMMHDKDHASYYHALENQIDFWYIAHFDLPRCMAARLLYATLLAAGAQPANLIQGASAAEAFCDACERAGEGDLIVVSGSFFTVSEVMPHIATDNSACKPHREASFP